MFNGSHVPESGQNLHPSPIYLPEPSGQHPVAVYMSYSARRPDVGFRVAGLHRLTGTPTIR